MTIAVYLGLKATTQTNKQESVAVRTDHFVDALFT